MLLTACLNGPDEDLPCHTYRNICPDEFNNILLPSLPTAPGAAWVVGDGRIGIHIKGSRYKDYDQLYFAWYKNGKKLDVAESTTWISDPEIASAEWMVSITPENDEGRGEPGTLTLNIPLASHLLNVDTGQAQCYDNDSSLPACPPAGSPFSGQDAQFGPVTRPATYVKFDGYVLDERTGLQWEDPVREDEASCFYFEGAGLTKWRNPGRTDWLTLLNLGAPGYPAEFEDRTNMTLVSYLTNQQTPMNLETGLRAADGTGKHRCLRETRVSPLILQQALSNNMQVVADFSSRLAWTSQNYGEPLSWKDALAFCDASTHAGYSDWRLPNLFELATLEPQFGELSLDYGKRIENVSGHRFWTSTTVQHDPEYAYQLAYGRDEILKGNKTGTDYVVCVRSMPQSH